MLLIDNQATMTSFLVDNQIFVTIGGRTPAAIAELGALDVYGLLIAGQEPGALPSRRKCAICGRILSTAPAADGRGQEQH